MSYPHGPRKTLQIVGMQRGLHGRAEKEKNKRTDITGSNDGIPPVAERCRAARCPMSKDPGLYLERFDPGSDKFRAILASNLGAVRTKMMVWRARG